MSNEEKDVEMTEIESPVSESLLRQRCVAKVDKEETIEAVVESKESEKEQEKEQEKEKEKEKEKEQEEEEEEEEETGEEVPLECKGEVESEDELEIDSSESEEEKPVWKIKEDEYGRDYVLVNGERFYRPEESWNMPFPVSASVCLIMSINVLNIFFAVSQLYYC